MSQSNPTVPPAAVPETFSGTCADGDSRQSALESSERNHPTSDSLHDVQSNDGLGVSGIELNSLAQLRDSVKGGQPCLDWTGRTSRVAPTPEFENPLSDTAVLDAALAARPTIVAFCRYRLRDSETARNATDVVFWRLRTKFHALRFPDARRVVAWLKQVASRVVHEFSRHGLKDRPLQEELTLDAPSASTCAAPIEELTYRDVEFADEALARSPEELLLERERQVAVRDALSCVDDRDLYRISEWAVRPAHSRSTSTERQAVLRARARARRVLARHGMTSARRIDKNAATRRR